MKLKLNINTMKTTNIRKIIQISIYKYICKITVQRAYWLAKSRKIYELATSAVELKN